MYIIIWLFRQYINIMHLYNMNYEIINIANFSRWKRDPKNETIITALNSEILKAINYASHVKVLVKPDPIYVNDIKWFEDSGYSKTEDNSYVLIFIFNSFVKPRFRPNNLDIILRDEMDMFFRVNEVIAVQKVERID